MLATIPPEAWKDIESTVLDLMVAAYDAGYTSGAGLDRCDPTDNPTLAWLISETRRRWAAELRAGRRWLDPARATPDELAAAPDWLAALEVGGGGP